MNQRTLRFLALIMPFSLASFLVGCSRDELSGPPELRLGRAECAECGMMISEDRCSCALLIERNGRREYMLFDDVACMVTFERDRAAEFTMIDVFVHDYSTRQWVRGADATILHVSSDVVQTPMGSGILAFGTSSAAGQAQSTYGGMIKNLSQLRSPDPPSPQTGDRATTEH